MEAPMCKLCGERHWRGVCPKFARKKDAAKAAVQIQAAKPPKPVKKKKKKAKAKPAAKVPDAAV